MISLCNLFYKIFEKIAYAEILYIVYIEYGNFF